jgi:hypothetical protein
MTTPAIEKLSSNGRLVSHRRASSEKRMYAEMSKYTALPTVLMLNASSPSVSDTRPRLPLNGNAMKTLDKSGSNRAEEISETIPQFHCEENS